jgi:hypothetical protein
MQVRTSTDYHAVERQIHEVSQIATETNVTAGIVNANIKIQQIYN